MSVSSTEEKKRRERETRDVSLKKRREEEKRKEDEAAAGNILIKSWSSINLDGGMEGRREYWYYGDVSGSLY